jgi:predicted TIM-barrel fold metal-dependent hydrolase
MMTFIDFHHHARPARFWDALVSDGRTIHGGRPFPPRTDPEQTLRMMDEVGITMAILSSPDADALFADRSFALEHARPINDFYVEIVGRWPHRFGSLVCLPMPHVDLSLEEIRYGLDELKMDGVLLCSSYLGRYTGSPEFDPVLEELNRRGTTVLVHPVTPIGSEKYQVDIPPFLVEFIADTTRCLINCLNHDIPRRFPRIKLIFSHAGGAAPYLAPRIALMDTMANPKNTLTVREAQAKALAGLRSFYYDTALSAVDSIFSTLGDTVGLDRVVFGSDFPQSSPALVQATLDGVRQSAVLSVDQKQSISHRTLLRLLPGLKERLAK